MKYKDWSPTGFDRKGLGLPDQQDWIVCPCGHNRDSDALEESNWAAQLETFGGESERVQIHRFGHWACGWFEILLVHPSMGGIADALKAQLDQYPVLDEMDLSQREADAQED